MLTALSSFDGAVTATWVAITGGSSSAVDLEGNSGGAVGPTAGIIDTVGAGSITIIGNPGASTLTTQLTGLTAHNVLLGEGTSTIGLVAPGTAGTVLTSNGASADPTFQAVPGSLELDGNTGGNVGPTAGVINVVGTGSLTVVGNPGTSTLTAELTGLTAHNVLLGEGTATVGLAAPGTAGYVLTSNGATTDPSFQSISSSGAAIEFTGNSGGPEVPLAGNFNILGTGSITTIGTANTETISLTGLTAHNVLLGEGTATVGLAAPGTAGFVLTSNGATTDPSFQAISSSGAVIEFTGNSGGAEVPLAGNFNILGTGSITTIGTANTETISLTGLTAHNVLLGEGTATIGLVAPSTAGFVLTSNGPAADPTFQAASSSSLDLAGNSGGDVGPTAGVINTIGSGSITIVGTPGTSTLVTALTGLTAHNVLIGEGNPTIGLVAPGTAGTVLTSNGPTADPTFQAVSGSSLDLTGNSGGAVGPTAGNINTVGAGSITIVGTPGTSTLTTELTGLTAHNVLLGEGTTTIGLAAPSTAGFVLTSNGATTDPSFQSISSSGAAIEFTGNSGGAEVPLAGNFNILGTGSITTIGTANTETISLTGLTAHNVLLGAGTATIGLAAPSTAGFVLTSNGASADPTFQAATGSSLELAGNSGGDVGPTAGVINVVGTGSITVVGNPGTSTLTAQLTGLTAHNVVLGEGTATVGLVAPGTAGFVLTSNGATSDPSFQSISSSGGVTSFTGNSGGAEVPLAGNFNILGAGSITTVGSANTETVELTGLTAHNVLLGEGTSTIGLAAPGTAGVPLVSTGATSDPAFGTAVVAGGGTGDTSFTAYMPIAGGTTSTGNLQSVTSTGTAGQVLTYVSSSALPTWQTVGGGPSFNAINQIVFTTSGTYTPTANMAYCIVEAVGPGGGASDGGNGGGGGGYAKAFFTAAQIGSSITVTIGTGGAGSTTATAGGTGTSTTFVSGVLACSITATSGQGSPAVGTGIYDQVPSGNGGTATVAGATSYFISSGSVGGAAYSTGNTGTGGDSFFGGGANALFVPVPPGDTAPINGNNGVSYGGGGGSGWAGASGSTGGSGANGLVIVTEYINN